MKKYIAVVIFLFLSFILCGCSFKKEKIDDLDTILKRGYITVGVKTDSPPFGYYENNNHAGIDIELAKSIAYYIFKDDSQDRIHFIDITPQNRIAKLNSGEVDILVATMSINEKRKLVINFSKPYYVTGQKLMVKKDSKITSLNQFRTNNKLVVIMGTTGEKIAKMSASNASFIGAKTYTEAFNYLQNSQADAILGDEVILRNFCTDNYKIVNRAYSIEYYAVAVRKQEDSKELLNKINAAISIVLDENKFNLKNFNINYN